MEDAVTWIRRKPAARANQSSLGDRTGPDHSTGYQYSSYRPPPPEQLTEKLGGLLALLKEYDSRRQKLQTEGGTRRDLRWITRLLTSRISLTGWWGTRETSLVNQDGLRRAVADVNPNLVIQVRRQPGRYRWPVYYLCRIHTDYLAEYSLVVEDLYLSPGYPGFDRRLVRMVRHGHERYFIRLSAFRDKVAGLIPRGAPDDSEAVDDLLLRAGRHVFQAAWHEDQRLGVGVAEHLDLPVFHQAIELLYLCLSAELCQVRTGVDETLLEFFRIVYDRPPIRNFLKMLTRLDGRTINDLPRLGGMLFRRLGGAFSDFLNREVTWKSGRCPLWKVVYANFSRLDLVGRALPVTSGSIRAKNDLEACARRVIGDLLQVTNSDQVASDWEVGGQA
jgi:hypothetical protein